MHRFSDYNKKTGFGTAAGAMSASPPDSLLQQEGEEEDIRLRQLQETLASDPDNPTHHLNLGLYLWRRGGESCKERAAEHFLASAKLNPAHGPAFRFLGHYYSTLDALRASKCYQRALTLNPQDFEAGEALCDLLDANRQETLEIAVCKEAADKSPRAFWAFRRLGYLQVHQKKWSEGVQSLQQAIRGYPACADLWEALGFAYQRLGMFTAAIKSYGRAIELEDSRGFALIESGNIMLMLGSFRDGVEQFRRALAITPHNVSALFGLASGLLGWSKECENSGSFDSGAALLEEASEVAVSCTRISGNISSAWKLHGDIQVTFARCFPWEDQRNTIDIDEDAFKISINHWKKSCFLAAISAKRSYQRAIHLSPWLPSGYADIAVAIDLSFSLEETNTVNRQLPERMSMGSLMLEGVNNEFWVILSCLSNDFVLKQHALIRGLQLDISLSIAWAYLGKLYRKLGEKQLARQAFDHARSIDPSLALPWAGMAVDFQEGKFPPNEAYESCLRAVQIMPLAEFQLGLGSLAVVSGHLLFPQVFAAVQQAVQRAPYYPELHNLNGLLYESRSNYQSAIAAYRQALFALHIGQISKDTLKSYIADVQFNLARSLCQAGHALDAAQECENLKKDGLLDSKGFQIYVVALWQLGKTDLALTVAKHLTENVSTMSQTCATAALGLICTLIYCITGHDHAATMILEIAVEFAQSIKLSLIVAALDALSPSARLQVLLLHNLQTATSNDVVTEMHSIVAIRKMIEHGSTENLCIERGVDYLKKTLHMYPDSNLLRCQLSSLLLSSRVWQASYTATRCIMIPKGPCVKNEISPLCKIHGTAGVACYACTTTGMKFSYPTCNGYIMHGGQGTRLLQRWLHQEPWNHEAHYLLVLNTLQKAREEKFPQHLCTTLKRLIAAALSKEVYINDNEIYKYQRFLLLLCASEISLQSGDSVGCINCVTDALRLVSPNCSIDRFFAHLQLCRIYAAQEDLPSLKKEYINCLHVKTDKQIGWISLKYLESRYKLQNSSSTVDFGFRASFPKENVRTSSNIWDAVFDLVCAQSFIWDEDFCSAEQALAHACSMGDADSCLFLCHGAVCMELARQQSGAQFLWRAVSSLSKAQEGRPRLPIVSLLLAQAEASLGARDKWERNLRSEWFAWAPESRPAELYFQMHLLARQPRHRGSIESSQSPERWILRALHANPSCIRYWKALHKLSRN